MNLLIKLGELPPEGGDRSTVRVLDAIPPEATQELFERLQRAWPSLAPNPLQVPSLPQPASKPQEPSGTTAPSAAPPALKPPAGKGQATAMAGTRADTWLVAAAEMDALEYLHRRTLRGLNHRWIPRRLLRRYDLTPRRVQRMPPSLP